VNVPKVKDLEQRLERTEQQLWLLQRVSRYMVRETNIQETLRSIVPLVVEFMACDSCLLYLLDRDELVLCASNTQDREAPGRLRMKVDEGLTGWVAREKRLLAISREAYQDPRFKFFPSLPEDTYEAFLSAPILCHNRVMGVINVQHRAPHMHSGDELETLTTIGEQVGCMLMLAGMNLRGEIEQSHAQVFFASGDQARKS
jgi:two-component system, response regulator PdtaR